MNHTKQPGRPTRVLFASLAAILLMACRTKAPGVPDAAEPSLAAGAKQDPCSLLEPREVEPALGGGIIGPPYRFKNEGVGYRPAADGDACRYEGAAFHFIEIQVEWEGGAQMMGMYGMVRNLAAKKLKGVLTLSDGSELTGEWDEAKVVGCCTFIAMRGDQLVTVGIAASNATLQQAAGIADAALKRIEKPLPLDGAAGVAAALAREAKRPKERNPCSIVSRAEVEAALQAPLTSDPLVDGNTCTYTYSTDLPSTIALTIRWRDSYSELRQDASITEGLMGTFGLGGDVGQKAPALIGPWETARTSPSEFAAVRDDVLVTAVASGAMSQEHVRNLVAAAMSKL